MDPPVARLPVVSSDRASWGARYQLVHRRADHEGVFSPQEKRAANHSRLAPQIVNETLYNRDVREAGVLAPFERVSNGQPYEGEVATKLPREYWQKREAGSNDPVHVV